ncbi:MAG: hypothetical protein H6624_00445 [Bdellovibrionaceae bacterium]|nr:hypothetical protein [Bdellovibrionales bacterium]MCB9082776.1 hypothetical protein [Pseudobdellovibrionaceae bacterium]
MGKFRIHWAANGLGLFFILLTFSPTGAAAPAKALYLGGGMLNYNLTRTTTSDNASSSFLGPMFYPLQARTFWNFHSDLIMAPRFAYTLLPREAQDGAADTTIMLFSFPLLSPLGAGGSGGWDWTYGLGLMFYQVKGKGGLVTLNNGTSTSQFARPGRDTTARNMTWEMGMAYTSADSKWRTEIEALFVSLLTERRSYSLMVTVNYQVGGGY